MVGSATPPSRTTDVPPQSSFPPPLRSSDPPSPMHPSLTPRNHRRRLLRCGQPVNTFAATARAASRRRIRHAVDVQGFPPCALQECPRDRPAQRCGRHTWQSLGTGVVLPPVIWLPLPRSSCSRHAFSVTDRCSHRRRRRRESAHRRLHVQHVHRETRRAASRPRRRDQSRQRPRIRQHCRAQIERRRIARNRSSSLHPLNAVVVVPAMNPLPCTVTGATFPIPPRSTAGVTEADRWRRIRLPHSP